MRTTFKLGLVVAVAAVLAVGFLPPLFAHGELDGFARDAAQKGSAVVTDESPDTVQSLVAQAIATHPGVHLDKVNIDGGTVTVTVSETVRTFISSFHLSSTEGSAGGE